MSFSKCILNCTPAPHLHHPQPRAQQHRMQPRGPSQGKREHSILDVTLYSTFSRCVNARPRSSGTVSGSVVPTASPPSEPPPTAAPTGKPALPPPLLLPPPHRLTMTSMRYVIVHKTLVDNLIDSRWTRRCTSGCMNSSPVARVRQGVGVLQNLGLACLFRPYLCTEIG